MTDTPPPAGDRPLLAAIQEWAQRALPAPPSGHGGPECQWCPLCQLASVLRGEHPELTDRMAEAGTALAGAVKALLDSTAARAGSGSDTPAPTGGAADGPAASRPEPPDKPQPRPRVQRIDIDDGTD